MTSWKTTSACTAAIGILLSGSAAFAEVTADQVWGDWKNYMSGFGYDLSSNENMSGDTLTITDITMTTSLPDEGGSLDLKMGGIAFTNNGDGTVSVSVPPVMPVTVNIAPTTGETVDLTLQYTTTGYTVNVSGDPDDMTYNYLVASAAISLDRLVVNGLAIDVGEASLSIADLIGSTNMQLGDLRQTKQKFNTGPISFALDFADPEGKGRVVANGDYEGISFEGGGSFPVDMDINDIVAMLASGFAFDGTYTFKSGATSFNIDDNGKVTEGSTKTGGGRLAVTMNQNLLQYGAISDNIEIKMSGGDIPLPIELAMKQWGFNLLMPIAKSDAEQDFALSMNITDFSVSDLLWGLADPTATLPRDPATIAFDLSGKAKLFFDLLDQNQMQAATTGAEAPGELNELKLNSLTVKAAGAELTGDGGFTFDNSDLTTFSGVPAPTGAIDLKMVGLNGLLDNLVAMGMLPEDQVTGMRMMMGMFAVVGDGDDTLTSKIEVSGDGQIKANGQRLK
ncbi:FIG081201: hypothetical protein [hydrothermal vent metagenome]|uniref:DUF2125 domain-containing protein n=1 Tax=hydrothermal vent metagenome TaxID=652676 RepID=A0A3B0SRX9_9ZZZZ